MVQGILPWRLLIALCIFLAIVVELWNVATRTARDLSSRQGARNLFTLAESDKATGSDNDELGLGAGLPDIPKTEKGKARLKADRIAYAKEIRAERARGLLWLAAITTTFIWCTGILNKDNALQP